MTVTVEGFYNFTISLKYRTLVTLMWFCNIPIQVPPVRPKSIEMIQICPDWPLVLGSDDGSVAEGCQKLDVFQL